MERNRKKTEIQPAAYEVHCPGSLEQSTKALNVLLPFAQHIIIIFLDLPQIKSQSRTETQSVSQSVKTLLTLPAPGGCMAVAHTHPYAHTDTHPSSTPTPTGFSVPPQGAALSFPDNPTQPGLYCSASSVSCWGF